jgi:hypothetical protein
MKLPGFGLTGARASRASIAAPVAGTIPAREPTDTSRREGIRQKTEITALHWHEDGCLVGCENPPGRLGWLLHLTA